MLVTAFGFQRFSDFVILNKGFSTVFRNEVLDCYFTTCMIGPNIHFISIFIRFRLLGPSATADVLHLSNSLYQEGGGHAQLLLNSNNFRLLQSEQEMSNTTVLVS